MDLSDPDRHNWIPVETGTLLRIAQQRARRRRVNSIAAATCGCLLLAGLGILWFLPAASADGFELGGITCGEVANSMPGFIAGTLPEEQATKVEKHLELCPICSRHFRREVAKPPLASSVPFEHRGTKHAGVLFAVR